MLRVALGKPSLWNAARFSRTFTSGVPLLEEAKAISSSDSADGPLIDKENPLHAPDGFRTWRNIGYRNLAPAGWQEWEDLPAPYNRYPVKVDPKDVENPGFLWKTFTDWKTGIPLAGLLSLPLFVFDVVIIDERFELMLIFWTTVALFNKQFGSTVKGAITSQIDEIREELESAESKYTTSLEECVDTYHRAKDVPQYLALLNEGERALRAAEAAARTRQMHIDERNRMEEMLDYLIMVKDSRDSQVSDEVTSTARMAAESALTADSKLQEATLTNAIAALTSSSVTDSVVEDLYQQEFAKAQAAATKKLAESGKASANDRELFAKRFGFAAEVTEDMMTKAENDPAAMALLTAKVGGATPSVGMKLTQKMPIDY